MGGGVLNGSLTNAGTVRPGSSPGQLDVTGDLHAGRRRSARDRGPGHQSRPAATTTSTSRARRRSAARSRSSRAPATPSRLVVDSSAFLDSGSRAGTFATVNVAGAAERQALPARLPRRRPRFGARLVVVQSPQNTTAPTADGVTSAGSPLSCSTGNWAGTPAPSFSVEWLRDGQPVPGATQTSYTIGDADAQHALVLPRHRDQRRRQRARDERRARRRSRRPRPRRRPSVSGAPQPGSVLSCATGSWSGFPAPALSVDWLRDGQPAGNDPQYTVTAQDAGHSLACHVTAGNGAGTKDAISGALGVAKSAEQLLSESSTRPSPGKIGLPSSTACLKERYLRLRVRQPSGVRISAVSVLGNGKKNKANKTAGRFNTHVRPAPHHQEDADRPDHGHHGERPQGDRPSAATGSACRSASRAKKR